MKMLLLLAAVVLFPANSVSADLKLSLQPTDGPAAAASTVTVQLLGLNTSDREVHFEAPRILPATLFGRSLHWPLQLRADAEYDRILASGEEFEAVYRLTLPPQATRRLMLEVETPAGEVLRTTLNTSEASAPPMEGVSPESSEPTPRPMGGPFGTSRSEAAEFQRTFAERLAPHEAMYFIYGNEDLAAKFQISFKYRLFGVANVDTKQSDQSLQFGYTQRSLWDLEGQSSPFYDTSYIPSVFYEMLRPTSNSRSGRFHWVGLQAGVRHESNGQSGSDSRSLNVLTVRSAWVVGRLNNWHLVVLPEFFAYVGGLSNNEDLDQYRAYGQLHVSIGRANGPALSYTGRMGEEFENFTTELNLTIPIETDLLDFGTYFLAQYFHGFGENLLDYNERTTSLRFGFSFVR